MHLAASRNAPVNNFLSSECLKTMFHGNKNHISRIFRSQNAKNFGSKSWCFKFAASVASTSLMRWNSSNRALHRLLGSIIKVNPKSSKLSFSKQWYIACKTQSPSKNRFIARYFMKTTNQFQKTVLTRGSLILKIIPKNPRTRHSLEFWNLLSSFFPKNSSWKVFWFQSFFPENQNRQTVLWFPIYFNTHIGGY